MSIARYIRLRRSFLLRAKWFGDIIEHQHLVDSGRNTDLALALKTLRETLDSSVERVIEIEDERVAYGDEEPDEDRDGVIEAALRLLRERIDSHDAHFARQSRGLSPAIQFLLRRRCAELNVAPRSLFVTVGEPGNFACSEPTFHEVVAHVQELTVTAADRTLAVTVPRIEGEHALWLPVTLGHELGHFLLRHCPPTSLAELDAAIEASTAVATVKLPQEILAEPAEAEEKPARVRRKLSAQKLTGEWLHELICDAYAVRQFGVAGYLALAEFLESVGTKEATGELFTHPPSYFRCQLMRRWVEIGGGELTKAELALLESMADFEQADEAHDFRWADAMLAFFSDHSDVIWDATSAWTTGGSHFWTDTTPEKIDSLVRRISEGIPPIEYDIPGDHHGPATPAEIVSAAWFALHDSDVRNEWEHLTYADFSATVDRLSLKAIEDFYFLASWNAASESAKVDPLSLGQTPEGTSGASGPGVLAASAINTRLSARDHKRIVLSPRLGDPVGASSVDVRLGSKFILFDRAAHPAFDALSEERPDPRTMQHRVERRWGEPFYLHPNQLVLASVLEYLVMPSDLSAQVITRSSYGRLGMITATAVQVHPGYRGCLTLELVNLGEIPIAIVPGQRIAQLMFFSTVGERHDTSMPKYDCPVGPEFSKVTDDKEGPVLRALREAR